MPTSSLNEAARNENARALAVSIGISETSAAELLDIAIVVTADSSDASAQCLGQHVISLLERTISCASVVIPDRKVTAEVVIGSGLPRIGAPTLYVTGESTSVTISRTPPVDAENVWPHPILLLLSACYITSAVLKLGIGNILPINATGEMSIDFGQLGVDTGALTNSISIGKTYLVGAGAVGNGFLWALRYLDIEGELHLVDYDEVEGGNLNRQMWFDETDIGKAKAQRLYMKAQPFFPRLTLVPREARLQQLPEKNDGPWLRRLVVAVDSRRARRSLQGEIPGEVFDASTTDIREVVLHYHRQPNELACLSCIYFEDEQELEREKHIADHLGVSVAQVKEHQIDEIAAATIAKRFPERFADPNQLVGIAYETLFKSLCGAGVLKTVEGRQIVAPFAFVSVLAGTLLALEVARRLQKGNHSAQFNYWVLSAWHPPIQRKQRQIPQLPQCEFCSNAESSAISEQLWREPYGKEDT